MDTTRDSVTSSTFHDGDHRAFDRRAVETRTIDRLRTRSAERGACTCLHDAAVAFDDLLVIARRRGLVENPDVLRSLGAVVHVIASAITTRDIVRDSAPPGGQIGSVLLDRAAARFSTRVVGTDIGRRPCPPFVLTALHDARHSLEAAGAPNPRLARPGASIVEE